jgi:uncharacterized glyoxalase superfamily protein PhnB
LRAAEDDKIMHAMLEAPNGMVLMGADTPMAMEYTPGNTHQRLAERRTGSASTGW